jgi:hypothetical protein
MQIRRPYIIYLIFLTWNILSIILSFIDSILLSRVLQIAVFILIGMAGLTFISHTHIFSNKIMRFIIIWWFYISFINLLFSGNPLQNDLETFIDINWWTTIFILFYSIFIRDFQAKYFKTLIRVFPFFYFVIFGLVSYKMLFYFGRINYGVIEAEEINSVYWILLLVPFAFLLDNKVLKYVILLSSLILIILSTKRGAAISLLLVILVSMMQDIFKGKNLLRNLLFGATLTFVLFLIYENTISRINLSVVQRLQETNIYDEPRMYLITDSWEKFKEKELRYQMFGSGHRSTAIDRGAEMLSKTSHNDYFEVLYNYGILGFALYLYFSWQVLMRIKFLYKIGGSLFQAYLASFIIFFVMSMLSHLIIYPTYFAFIIIIWALAEAKIENRSKTLRSFNFH